MSRSSINSVPSHQRKLRYRKLLENVQALDDSVLSGNDTIKKTKHVVQEAEKLLNDGAIQERVEHPSESLLDSRVLLAASDMVTRCADNISGNSNVYDPSELAEHIRNNSEFWKSICIPGQIPNYCYLYGSFLPGPPIEKPQKARKQVEKQKKHDKREPENITTIEKTEEGSEMVVHANKLLSRHFKKNNSKPISFYHLVLDPEDFGHTVENIYHISFLIRDGLAAITIDDSNGLPFISPISKDDREKLKSNPNIKNNQFINSLDMAQWKEAIKAFKITEPLMKRGFQHAGKSH